MIDNKKEFPQCLEAQQINTQRQITKQLNKWIDKLGLEEVEFIE